MNYWLVKTEASKYSIDNLKVDKKTLWTGVRNYQARNFLKSMKKGDLVLIYHSVEDPTGIVGLGEISKEAVPDPCQFDKKSDYYEPKASMDTPRWFSPEIKFKEKFKHPLNISTIKSLASKANSELKNLVLIKKGSRLSVQPVTEKEFLELKSKLDSF